MLSLHKKVGYAMGRFGPSFLMSLTTLTSFYIYGSRFDLNWLLAGISLSASYLVIGLTHWLTGYVYDFLAIGVSTSRKVTPYRSVEYSQPSWPMLIWRGNRKRDKESDLLLKLSRIASVSKKRAARAYRDAMFEMTRQNPGLKGVFSDWLEVKEGFFDERSSRR